MRYILFFLLACSLPAFGQNNIKKNASVAYTQGPPTYSVSLATSSEIAIDTTTGRIYQYHRPTSTWLQLGQGIDVISGGIPPAYTPLRNMSRFAINGIDSLYYYTGSAWVHINAGGSGGGGSGHVILEGNTPRAQKDSLEFRSNGIIVLAASNTGTRTIVEATIQTAGVGAAEIASGAVGNSELAANAIDSSKVCAGCIALSDINQSGASSGQVPKWSGSAWVPGNAQQAWATGSISSPVYTPTLTDSIIHNGSVRIKTSYPTPRNPTGTGTIPPNEVSLAIEHSHGSGSTAPTIYIEAVGDTSINDAFIPFMWSLDSGFATTKCLPMSIFMGKIRNASAVGHNFIGGIGFNLSQAGGPLIQGQPYAADVWEQNFAANDGTNGDMERWFSFNGSNGTSTYRASYMTASRLDCSGSVYSIAGNTIYIDPGPPLYGTGVHYGQWGSNSLVVNSVGTNQNFEYRISGTGTGSTTLNMRDPNSGSAVSALTWENGRAALQLSPTKPVLFRGSVFALDGFYGGPTVIGNGFPDIDNSTDTINFGNDPTLTGGTYDNYGNYRFFLGSGDGLWIGEYGLTKGEFFGQGTAGGDWFLSKGYAVSTTGTPSFGVDAGTGNVGIKKQLNSIGSSAALQVGIGGFENAGLVFQGTNEITGTTTVTASTTVTDNLYKPGSTQATLTFNLPGSPAANQLCTVCFNNVVTSLTISGNGTTLSGTLPSAAAVGDCFAFKYYAGITAWIRTN